jgi:peptide/nickel transport system permease protein
LASYIARRLLATLPVVVLVTLFVFLLLRLAPGDPAVVIAGEHASAADVERIRATLGLNLPLHQQFLVWVGTLLSGNLGASIISGMPISTLIAQRIEPTLSIAATTIVLSVLVALPMGIAAAWGTRTWVDRTTMVFAIMGFSLPVFLVGYVLIYLFSMKLGWFPVQGYRPLAQGMGPWLQGLTLPTVALSFTYVALLARTTRASMLEVLAEDYIRTAQAKGVRTRALLFKHAFSNAAVPVVTVVGIGITLLISGVVITETVFNIPGLGRLTVDAILSRDYPIIQALILIFAGVYVVINLLIDVIYVFLDPRIEY